MNSFPTLVDAFPLKIPKMNEHAKMFQVFFKNVYEFCVSVFLFPFMTNHALILAIEFIFIIYSQRKLIKTTKCEYEFI